MVSKDKKTKIRTYSLCINKKCGKEVDNDSYFLCNACRKLPVEELDIKYKDNLLEVKTKYK